MNGLIMAAQLLLSLTILVFVHELGHFLAARFFKMRVHRFYLFFDFMFPLQNVLNFAIFKKKIGDTEYGLGWFPLGGYVNIAGMVDETTDAETLKKEPEPWEFRAKPAWQRMIVLLGGIIFNIIFGIFIYSMWLLNFQKEYLPVTELKGGIAPYEYGQSIGFRLGDKVLKVNGNTPERYEDLFPLSIVFGGNYTVERTENGATKTVDVEVPKDFHKSIKEVLFAPVNQRVRIGMLVTGGNAEKAGLKQSDGVLKIEHQIIHNYTELKAALSGLKGSTAHITVLRDGKMQDISCAVDTAGRIGFMPEFVLSKSYTFQKYSIPQAFKYGTQETFKLFALQGISIFKMAKQEVSFKENVGGPIAMAKAFGTTWDWSRFWLWTAVISVGLAFMNLLPIPALDGGHVVFILIEMITGKPVNEKIMQAVQNAGTIIILGLMAFVFYNDISKFFK